MYKRILVAIDGSETSRRALDEALQLAREGSGRLHLIHVVGIAPSAGELSGSEFEDYRALMLEAAHEVLDNAVRLASTLGMTPEAELVEIPTSQYGRAVLETAQRWGADLIVLGTHGRTGLRHLLLGSVAEDVVRHAFVPVLLVRGDEKRLERS